MKRMLSMAAAVLHGAQPDSVADYNPADREELCRTIADLAEATGMPIPEEWRFPEPIEESPFPADAHEAQDHYEWAKANGLTDPDTRRYRCIAITTMLTGSAFPVDGQDGYFYTHDRKYRAKFDGRWCYSYEREDKDSD